MKRTFRNMKLRDKFILVSVAIIMVLIIFILGIVYSQFYKTNVQDNAEVAEQECSIINNRLSSMYDNLIACANMATSDINRIYREEGTATPVELSSLSIRRNLYTVLDYDKRCFHDIDSILFLAVDGNDCFTEGNLKVSGEDRNNLLKYIPASGSTSGIVLPMEKRDCLGEGMMLTFGKRVICMDDGRNLGYLLINVSEKQLSEAISGLNLGSGSGFALIDEENRIVSSQDTAETGQLLKDGELDFLKGNRDWQIVRTAEEDKVEVKRDIDDFGWTLIFRGSMEKINRGIADFSKLIIVLGMICAITAAVLIARLTLTVTKPLEALTYSAKRVQQGDFTAAYETDSNDEVGQLAQTFDIMLQKIQQLIDGIKQEEKEKSRYQFALLQAQIKPHFLYNTLDLIYIMCQCDEQEKAAKVTKALADFYRISLSNGREIITLRDELNNTENYLYIQRERYADIFDFQLDISPMILDYEIVKLTLQPLVENAIYHGLKVAGHKGTIRLTGRFDGDLIVLMVKDDGIGMDRDKLASVMQDTGDNKSHYGLYSVKRRLQIYYGDSAHMNVDSVPGKGTCITISIPKVVGGIDD